MGPLEKTQEISESGNIIADADTVENAVVSLGTDGDFTCRPNDLLVPDKDL